MLCVGPARSRTCVPRRGCVVDKKQQAWEDRSSVGTSAAAAAAGCYTAKNIEHGDYASIFLLALLGFECLNSTSSAFAVESGHSVRHGPCSSFDKMTSGENLRSTDRTSGTDKYLVQPVQSVDT